MASAVAIPLLTLHGRSREQGFAGTADWSAIAAVKRRLPIPLIANGDIRSPDPVERRGLSGPQGSTAGQLCRSNSREK